MLKFKKVTATKWQASEGFTMWTIRKVGKQYIASWEDLTGARQGERMVGITLGNLTEAKQATLNTRQRWIETNQI